MRINVDRTARKNMYVHMRAHTHRKLYMDSYSNKKISWDNKKNKQTSNIIRYRKHLNTYTLGDNKYTIKNVYNISVCSTVDWFKEQLQLREQWGDESIWSIALGQSLLPESILSCLRLMISCSSVSPLLFCERNTWKSIFIYIFFLYISFLFQNTAQRFIKDVSVTALQDKTAKSKATDSLRSATFHIQVR